MPFGVACFVMKLSWCCRVCLCHSRIMKYSTFLFCLSKPILLSSRFGYFNGASLIDSWFCAVFRYLRLLWCGSSWKCRFCCWNPLWSLEMASAQLHCWDLNWSCLNSLLEWLPLAHSLFLQSHHPAASLSEIARYVHLDQWLIVAWGSHILQKQAKQCFCCGRLEYWSSATLYSTFQFSWVYSILSISYYAKRRCPGGAAIAGNIRSIQIWFVPISMSSTDPWGSTATASSTDST